MSDQERVWLVADLTQSPEQNPAFGPMTREEAESLQARKPNAYRIVPLSQPLFEDPFAAGFSVPVERERIEVRSKDLQRGDLLLIGPEGGAGDWGLVQTCWHTESDCGASIEGFFYSFAWSPYEILTVMRMGDGS